MFKKIKGNFKRISRSKKDKKYKAPFINYGECGALKIGYKNIPENYIPDETVYEFIYTDTPSTLHDMIQVKEVLNNIGFTSVQLSTVDKVENRTSYSLFVLGTRAMYELFVQTAHSVAYCNNHIMNVFAFTIADMDKEDIEMKYDVSSTNPIIVLQLDQSTFSLYHFEDKDILEKLLYITPVRWYDNQTKTSNSTTAALFAYLYNNKFDAYLKDMLSNYTANMYYADGKNILEANNLLDQYTYDDIDEIVK